MKIIFRAQSKMFKAARADLQRTHPYAHERVGFLLCRAGRLNDNGLVILAEGYYPVEDDDYLRDDSVGAMMGPAAIRKAMQRAYAGGAGDISLFHVHMHEHEGMPGFSHIDVSESLKFVPDFFNVAPMMPHGVVVLSHDRSTGLCWKAQDARPVSIKHFACVGAPLEIWEVRL